MELGEPSAKAYPRRPPLSPPGATFAGTLRGPTGLLAGWPFLLRRDGRPLGPTELGGGRAANDHREGCWWSGDAGEFRFEQMPEGCYALEVLFLGGRLERRDPHLASVEDGDRAVMPGRAEHEATLAPAELGHIA